MTLIGVDVSKATLDVCFEGTDVQRFENNVKGFRRIARLLPAGAMCIMESTSTYGYEFAEYIVGKGFNASILNPLRVKRLAQLMQIRTKTDKIDARIIREYGYKIGDLPEFVPPSARLNELRQMQSTLEMLINQRTGLRNHREAMCRYPRLSRMGMTTIRSMIGQLDRAIDKLEKEIERLAREEYPEIYDKLISIKGVGKRAASMLLIITHGFTRFVSAKKLSSYIGVSPRIIESGSSVRPRTHISKIGMGRARAILYMCAQTARKHNAACRALYDRLVEKGKAKKVALLAVVNKLIHQAFACATKKQYYDEKYYFSLAN